MKTYKWATPENEIVLQVDEDGLCRMSGMRSAFPDDITIEPADPVVAPIPSEVTMRQARLALLQSGKLSQVEAALAALPEPQKSAAQIEWEYSNTVKRDHSFTQSMAQALGMTEAEMDTLFTLAATL
jgi:predicted component of type VI protein secretion system